MWMESVVMTAMAIQSELETEPEVDPSDLDDESIETAVVELLQAAVGDDIARVDRRGDRIKQLMAAIIVRQQADGEVSSQLHEELASMLRETVQESEDVGVGEVAFALWTELAYIAEKVAGDEDDEDETDGPQSEEGPVPDRDDGSDQQDDDDSNSLLLTGDESEGSVSDPAFQ
ncbi:hypothetical protein ATJ93_4651 [Halopiger aswanensis]|uniref:Uncharacterized protein n=2 Tax=Halopiger aswanensis TaxID=148449 RepID=A0A419VVN8_9EURY|nr:hypothetical protein ATJ93_4651 [Halopiger aswanensis]